MQDEENEMMQTGAAIPTVAFPSVVDDQTQTVWVALRMPAGYAGGVEVLGVFSDPDKARAAATTVLDVVGSVPLDVVLPDGDWQSAAYPVVEAS